MGGLIKAFVGALVLATAGIVYSKEHTKATEDKKKKAKDNLLVKAGFDNVVGVQPTKDQRTNPVLRIEFVFSVKNLSGVEVTVNNIQLLLEYRKPGATAWTKLGISPIPSVPGALAGIILPNGQTAETKMQMDITGWDGIAAATSKTNAQRLTVTYDLMKQPQTQTFDVALSPKISGYVSAFKLKNGLHGLSDVQNLLV